jgi:hypothetical protein
MDKVSKISYWKVSQFDPQPANFRELIDLIDLEKATRVEEDFEPTWGGGVYKLNENSKLSQHKINWDSSD